MPELSTEHDEALTTLFSQDLSLADIANMVIQHQLNKNNSDVMLVAKKLGIGKSTIYRKLKNKEVDVIERLDPNYLRYAKDRLGGSLLSD